MPTTISHAMALLRLGAHQSAVAAPVYEQGLEVGLRAALRHAVLRRDAHVVADLAQRDAATAAGEAQPASQRLLLDVRQAAGVTARRYLRTPVQCLQLARVHRQAQAGSILAVGGLAAHARAVRLHRGELLAEFETFALLAARRVTRSLEHAAAQR